MMHQTNQDGPSLAGQPATPAAAPTTAATTGAQPQGAQPAAPRQAPGPDLFLLMIVPLALVIGMSWFSGRKQSKRKERMLADLKKHDRVVTTGGMIGFVSEVKPDFVVLKLEEGRDVRVTFTRDAIAAVVKSAEPAASESAKSDA